MNMKKLTTLLVVCALCNCIHAEPAQNVVKKVVQPDGTTLLLTLAGDERLHYYVTSDGYPVLEEHGVYYYAEPTADNLVCTKVPAHAPDTRTTSEQSMLQKPEMMAKRLSQVHTESWQKYPMAVGKPMANLQGTKRGLVILMAFKNLPFVTPNVKQAVENMCNQPGYNYNQALGSVNDYFKDQSNGTFDLQFDVVGPFTAEEDMEFYGNNGGMGKDQNVQLLITEAIYAADADGVDFRQYDWDNDGYVEQIYVLYAGYSESDGAPSSTIWPHESVLQTPRKRDGVRIKTYACSSELTGRTGNTLDGISTMCHEFSHCLGLPDFYDVKSNSSGSVGNYGMNQWSIMASGTRNADGNIPPSFTGYEKAFCGWDTPIELNEPTNISHLQPIASGGKCYKIVNPNNPNEYYLLENRNGNTNWDKGLNTDGTGAAVNGLLVYHVTYDENIWAVNEVNASTRTIQRMVPIPADGNLENYYSTIGGYHINPDGLAGDLYPYRTNSGSFNNAITDGTSPAASLNTPNTDGTYLMHKNITDITKNTDGSISFSFSSTTTDITSATAHENSKNNYYNLKGMFMGTDAEKLPKGIYILNGKKVVIDR